MTPKVFSGLIIFLLFTFNANAQLNEFIITPQPAPAVIPVFTSHPDKAAIIIYSAIEGIQYESNTEGIFRVLTDDASGTVTLIVYPEKQFIKVKKRGFLEGLINIPPIEQRQVLYYKIEPKTETENTIPVTILSDPEGADIYIDDEFKGSGKTFKLSKGEHMIRAAIKDHYDYHSKIIVSEQDVFFNLKLSKINPVLLTITSDPKDAEITIDNMASGKTDKSFHKMPGSHIIRVSKSGYLPQEETIIIEKDSAVNKHFLLIKNTGLLNIIVNPSDSRVKLNNDEIESLTGIELAPGNYKIEVSRKGYESFDEILEIQQGQTVNRNYALKGKFGSLQLTVKPLDAAGELYYEGSLFRTFKGSFFFENLPEGDYILQLTAAGYKMMKSTISIKYNISLPFDAELEKGSDIPEGFVFVQGGTFQMGSNSGDVDESPVRQVTVSDFMISKYEVTQGLWKKIMTDNPSYFKGDDNLPVELVTWQSAVEFCNKLSEKEKLEKVYSGTGDYIKVNLNANGYRLPTEAEWEFAARGGNGSKGYKYSGSNDAYEAAWFDNNSDNKTHPVGQKKPNELGLYDMSGNLWEWCWDWHGNYPSGIQNNPTGPSSGKLRVGRGGSFEGVSSYLRVSNRDNGYPTGKDKSVGFRIARSVLK